MSRGREAMEMGLGENQDGGELYRSSPPPSEVGRGTSDIVFAYRCYSEVRERIRGGKQGKVGIERVQVGKRTQAT
jgi:hypothetical protein